jgi:hypothetical protein
MTPAYAINIETEKISLLYAFIHTIWKVLLALDDRRLSEGRKIFK